MSQATFGRAIAVLSVGGGAQRVVVSFYDLDGGARCAWLDERADLATLLWRMEMSFRQTGGVPTVLEVRPSRPFTKAASNAWSTSFLRFCDHFSVVPAAAQSSTLNGSNVRLLEQLQCRDYESLDACERLIQHHSRVGNTIEALRPIPPQAFVSSNAFFRRVAGDGFISYRRDAYSAPDDFRGKMVWVEIRDGGLEIRSKEGRLLARHVLGSGRGDVFLIMSHFEKRQPRLPASLRRAFLACFPLAEPFILRVQAARDKDAAEALRLILKLTRTCSVATLTKAMQKAIAYNNFSPRFLQGAVKLGKPPFPRPSAVTEQGLLFDHTPANADEFSPS